MFSQGRGRESTRKDPAKRPGRGMLSGNYALCLRGEQESPWSKSKGEKARLDE